MCRRVTCKKCGQPSFAGCGMHVEQVLGDVAPADRCHCHTKARPAATPSSTGSTGGGTSGGLWARLTRR